MTKAGSFRSLPPRRVASALTVMWLLASACGLTILASTATQAQSFSAIYAFTAPGGVLPNSGVTIRAGVLYGTTLCAQYPNNCGAGTVYQVSRVGSVWAHTAISLLSVAAENPQARVVFGPDNLLYGTAALGGPHSAGGVFTLMPVATICKTANCFWPENVLHQFTGSPDGDIPGNGDLVWDPMGNIYGTTEFGGTSDLGTVFQMTKSGNGWNEMPVYSFTGPDGLGPVGGVILDSDGNLFGTTAEGGLYGDGTVFELTYVDGIGWTETVLYSFQNQSDGWFPYAGLVKDSAGNLYGTTSDGGNEGGGTVFELSPMGNSWAFTLLYSFSGQQGHMCGPQASLTIDDSGNLYGTTMCDGTNSLGNVFKLTNTQNGWEYSSLYDFTDGPDGAEPFSNVTIDTDGTLYGTATIGGNSSCNPPYGCGTVWMIKP
jgi:uncharacterized repeat protein (TIGR03803 family)